MILCQHPFAAGYGTDRHHSHIRYQLPGQATGQVPLELGMLLKVTLVAVPTHEPATLPHKGDRPFPDPSVTNPPRSHIMHRSTLEPAPRTTRHRPGRLDLHHNHHLAARYQQWLTAPVPQQNPI